MAAETVLVHCRVLIAGRVKWVQVRMDLPARERGQNVAARGITAATQGRAAAELVDVSLDEKNQRLTMRRFEGLDLTAITSSEQKIGSV